MTARMSPNPFQLDPRDFPVKSDDRDLKTRDGRTFAQGTTPQITAEIAERLNEQADREEEDRWSA